MKILFVHQNFPGQYRFVAPHLARQEGNEVVSLGKRKDRPIPGIRRAIYEPAPGPANSATHDYLVKFEEAVRHGEVAAGAAARLKRDGFTPDIICAHPGWGEALYLKDIYPGVPQLHYCEYYFHAFGGATHFDPKQPVLLDTLFRTRTRNVVTLLSLESCEWGVSPTRWQESRFPGEYRHKISILHDGINVAHCRPNPDRQVTLPGGVTLTRADEVVTYVARNLEPTRGFPTLMKTAEELCRRRPKCHVLIVGGDEVSYGAGPPDGGTYREMMLADVDVDPSRVHFLGKVSFEEYLAILQISSAHVYLTIPFVLSWSLLEAMAVGCVIVGSNTAPVTEVIEEGHNGLLTDFFDHLTVTERVEEALDHPERMEPLRQRARETVVERYSVAKCLPAQVKLIEDVAAGRQPAKELVEGAALALEE
jgi:glycosyltransferase involved in cell wall biosynthesis